jgi:hypothetical protein
MRLRYALLILIMELLMGCKREKQINYAPMPITPVPALFVQDLGSVPTSIFLLKTAYTEGHSESLANHFTSKDIDFSPTLPLASIPCIIATYLPLRSEVKKLISVLPCVSVWTFGDQYSTFLKSGSRLEICS